MIGIRMKEGVGKGPHIGPNVEIYSMEDGKEIDLSKNARSCVIEIYPDDILTATIELYINQIDMEGVVTYLAAKDYKTGQTKSVKRIIFKDGSILEEGR